MKWLLLLALLIFPKAYPCGTDSIESVNLCQVEDLFSEIFSRMFPSHYQVSQEFYSGEPNTYTYDVLPEIDEEPQVDLRTAYERLIMPNKPAIGDFELELVNWKNEKIADINWKNRVKAQDDVLLRNKMSKCNVVVSNVGAALWQAHKDNNTTLLDCLESKQAEVDAEKADADSKEGKKKAAKSALKNADCSTLTPKLLEDMCEILK